MQLENKFGSRARPGVHMALVGSVVRLRIIKDTVVIGRSEPLRRPSVLVTHGFHSLPEGTIGAARDREKEKGQSGYTVAPASATTGGFWKSVPVGSFVSRVEGQSPVSLVPPRSRCLRTIL